MRFNKVSKSLINISGNLMSIEFNEILKLIEFSGFFIYKVDINRNSRLAGSSEISKFQFRV